MEVLIAASRKEKVEDRVAVAEFGGLKAMVMDIDSFAAQTAFELMETQLPDGGREQVIALVDVGASMMNINVLRNNQSVYMREQPFGGNQLTQEIQRHYNLSAEEAEAAKRNGGLPDTYEAEVLQPFMDTLALEVTRALQFFYTSTQYNQVNHIFLSGGCATIPGLDQVVAKRTEVNSAGRQSLRDHAGLAQDQAAPAAAGRPGPGGGLRPGHAEVRRMIPINLLPHRAERRKAQQRQFLAMAGDRRRGRHRAGGPGPRLPRAAHRHPGTRATAISTRRSPSSTSRSTRSRSSRSRPRQCWRARRWSSRCRAIAPRRYACSTSWCASCPTACT